MTAFTVWWLVISIGRGTAIVPTPYPSRDICEFAAKTAGGGSGPFAIVPTVCVPGVK